MAQIGFGDGKGKLIVLQLFTSRRPAKGFGEEGHYGLSYENPAVHDVLQLWSPMTAGPLFNKF